MKTKYFILAAIVGMTFASCSNDEFIGDNSPTLGQEGDGSIQFSYSMQNVTRAGDIYGEAAADILGNNFYVMGTKGSEGSNRPSEKLVFDNYLVHFGLNTAGTTKSNTANWEYVGVTPDGTNYVKLGSYSSQTIKYWDYSEAQYDFFAFSVGKGYKAIAQTAPYTTPTGTNISVTPMKYGETLTSGTVAYTLGIPSKDALSNVYITDIITVDDDDYGKEVQLKFKNLGSKIRLAIYETVPGYSIKEVKFYRVDGTTTDLSSATKYDDGYLISANETYGFATSGKVEVTFPSLGTDGRVKTNYNKASANVTLDTPGSPVTYQEFGTLNYTGEEDSEDAGDHYLGRTLPTATFAGVEAQSYYQTVFPVSAANASALTLRVDYTLVSTDGSGETIKVYGAKAVVPSTYTTWQPNYAYTYIFKISDNTNGWTNTAATKSGLFPITFDAVVADIKEVSGEQTTITTVSTPSITTYQQKHEPLKPQDEYSKGVGKNVYIQVMDNNDSPATPITNLNGTTKDDTNRSLLYAITKDDDPYLASEALVMDALLNQSSADAGVITGRNSVVLTPATIALDQTTIVNGVDDKVINLGGTGKVAMINMSSTPAGNYAYVYDYTAADKNKTYTTIWQPSSVTAAAGAIASGKRYVTLATLNTLNEAFASNKTTAGDPVNADYLYFSRSTDDGTNYTYSYYSVDGKTNVDGDLLKVQITAGNVGTGDGSTSVAAGTIIFDTYVRNDGSYAVKVIKVVD